MSIAGVFMKNNKLYSVLLGMLLVVPGQQVLCSEQPPVPQGILDRLNLSMPAAPAWWTNFTSSLSDTKKYVLYGTLAATFAAALGYVSGIFSSSFFTPVPTSIDNQTLIKPSDDQRLDDVVIRRNIAIILNNYDIKQRDISIEKAFNHYVCPVFQKQSESLRSEDNWKSLFDNCRRLGKKPLLGNDKDCSVKMLKLINKTCSYKVINSVTPSLQKLSEQKQDEQKKLQLLGQ